MMWLRLSDTGWAIYVEGSLLLAVYAMNDVFASV